MANGNGNGNGNGGGGGSLGPAVDRDGGSVVDPTPNVLRLVESETRRQDDLRNMQDGHLAEGLRTNAAHAKEIRLAETARIDAIRAVDVGAVNRAAEVASTRATTLAGQVANSAETLRTQVAAAATAAAVALAAALDPIQKDIADLRRAQYEAQGVKTQTVETAGGSRAWIGLAIAGIVGVSGFLLGIVSIVIALMTTP